MTEVQTNNQLAEEKVTLDVSEEIQKAVKAIEFNGGDEYDQGWILDNIVTIQAAVKSGLHNRVFYPASGVDAFRVAIAYQASEVIAVDVDPDILERVITQIQTAGFLYEQKSIDATTTEIVFDVGETKRKITFVRGDAREEVIKASAAETFDVLHIYFPTGADQDVTEDELYLRRILGDRYEEDQWDSEKTTALLNHPEAPIKNEATQAYNVVIQKIKNVLTLENYRSVKTNGFFVFSESILGYFTRTPKSVLDIISLQETAITKRHPYTVSTSFYPTKTELAEMSQVGYVYHKQEEVSDVVIEAGLEALDELSGMEYIFMEVMRGNFQFLRVTGKQDTPISVLILQFYQRIVDSIEAQAHAFEQAGVIKEKIDVYRREHDTLFRLQLKNVKERYKAFLELYDLLAEKIDREELTHEEALVALGVEKNNYGKYSCKEWPMAMKLISPDDNVTFEDQYDKYRLIIEFDNRQLDIASK